jgi:prophage endopeptidase
LRVKSTILFWVITLATGAFGGWKVTHDRYIAEIATLEAAQSAAVAKVAEAARDRLLAAQARSDEIETRLAQADADRQTLALEHSREIKRLTTGRACLNAGTVRLLNASGPRSDTAAVPASAGQPVAADAGAASDTDVAEWIDHAKRQYDTCRDRLQAVIDWHPGQTDD